MPIVLEAKPQSTIQREYLSVADVAALYGVSAAVVRLWLRQGLLPAYRLRGSRLVRVRLCDIESRLEPVAAAGPHSEAS